MQTKRLTLGFIALTLLACNYVTQLIAPPTSTPPQPTPSLTLSPAPEATLSPTTLAPANIPPQCTNQPIATVQPDVALAQPTLEAKPNPVISTSEQLKIFDQMVNDVEANYVYPDYNGNDWNEIKTRYRAKVEAGLDTENFYLELQHMVFELGDEHSAYLSPVDVEADQAELSGDNNYVGVGVYGQYNFEKNSFVIITTFPGSAAEYAGLQAHDSILEVDGLPITEELGNRLRGPECSVAIAKVQAPGEAPREVMMMRYRISGAVPLDARLVNTTDGSKIGYIFLPSFFDETLPDQMEEALNRFGQLDGLIIDLRLNGGGSSTVAYPIMSFFTEGKLGDFVSRSDSRPLRIRANPVQNSQTVPLVVLVGDETVSFAEIFAGVMKDSGRAKVVGQTSLGNVELLLPYNYRDGSLMWLATETFRSAFSAETNWERDGIIPDVEAHAAWDDFIFETDPAIAASLQLLGHQ